MKILLDLDGVLIDFVQRALEQHGVKMKDLDWPAGLYCLTKVLGISDEEFWRMLDSHDYWSSLPWTEEGREIVALAEKAVGKKNVYLCTSPTLSPFSGSGKMAWIYRELKGYQRKFLIGAPKYLCADKETILIDDAEHNINKFVEHGGHAFLFPRHWNKRHEDQDRGLDMLKKFFGQMMAAATFPQIIFE